jgi:NodT family efflux transporter outer membrane factor (OMF) lipoprotein
MKQARSRAGQVMTGTWKGHSAAIATALTGCTLFTACQSVGPEFVRPDSAWLDDWQDASTKDATEGLPKPEQPPPDDWWRNFNDPILNQLIAEAQRRNPSVRTAGLRIMEARAQLGIARSALYPQVQQLTGDALSSGEQTKGEPSTSLDSYSVGFVVGWEIDFWGKFRRGIESSDAAYLASIAQYDDVHVLLAAQVASLYATIRTLELRWRIAQQNAALQERSLEITQNLFKSGNESELDVQQATSLYLGTLATLPELETALRQAQNALSVLLARVPGPLAEMEQGREQIPTATLAMIVDMPADLLRRRPDVRAAEMQLAAQSALIGVSEAALLPSIALPGSVGLAATSADWSIETISWGIGPSLLWNVFDYGRLKNQVLVQDARFQQLYEVYQDTVLRAARELDDAAVAFAKGRVQIELLDQAVTAARRSLDIATIQYREGLVDFERVLDSQRTLFTQQDRLVSNRGNVSQSLIALYKAMGGGWHAARREPVLDQQTREVMIKRSNWKGLLDAPLPPPESDSISSP